VIGKFVKYITVGPLGVVCAEEDVKLSWFGAFKRLFSGGVKPRPPDAQDFLKWARVGKPLKRYKCRVCGVYFWSWKKRHICYKWRCYRQS